jgi:predicted enzyme related to lactoylglutathione lyase
MSPPIARVILYVRDPGKVAAFYRRHFRMRPKGAVCDSWIALASGAGGCTLALHRAAVSQKSGAAAKVVFGVKEVSRFKAKCKRGGLDFGPIHRAEGFEYANAKDPAGNSISISSRGLR